jgi:hypothetical protein
MATNIDQIIDGRPITTTFPVCGGSNTVIEPAVPELETYSNFAAWVDVGKYTEIEDAFIMLWVEKRYLNV